ncbi:MAG: class I SAM-dependent methyltransferase [Alphaproteobacteria bacterium]
MAKRRAQRNAGEALSELWPGENPARSVPLLKALHILTREGALNQDSRRKLKQVLHLTQLLRPAIEDVVKEKDEPVLADLGAGKSYLGFVLYDLIFAPTGKGSVIGVEAREELVATSRALARQCGFARMEFICAPIANADLPDGRADIVTALHACDTATDDAIRFALRHEAKAVALVPCCQAELSRQLEGRRGPLAQLWRHPIQRREFGAHVTNVMRSLFLEAHGYKVRVTELVGWEHSLKNELILAERHQRSNAMAKAAFDRLAAELGVRPAQLS